MIWDKLCDRNSWLSKGTSTSRIVVICVNNFVFCYFSDDDDFESFITGARNPGIVAPDLSSSPNMDQVGLASALNDNSNSFSHEENDVLRDVSRERSAEEPQTTEDISHVHLQGNSETANQNASEQNMETNEAAGNSNGLIEQAVESEAEEHQSEAAGSTVTNGNAKHDTLSNQEEPLTNVNGVNGQNSEDETQFDGNATGPCNDVISAGSGNDFIAEEKTKENTSVKRNHESAFVDTDGSDDDIEEEGKRLGKKRRTTESNPLNDVVDKNDGQADESFCLEMSLDERDELP